MENQMNNLILLRERSKVLFTMYHIKHTVSDFSDIIADEIVEKNMDTLKNISSKFNQSIKISKVISESIYHSILDMIHINNHKIDTAEGIPTVSKSFPEFPSYSFFNKCDMEELTTRCNSWEEICDEYEFRYHQEPSLCMDWIDNFISSLSKELNIPKNQALLLIKSVI